MLATSAISLLGIGAAAAVLLAVASRLLKVEENPLIELVTEALPGANCGGCGFAGCEAYAAAVVTNEDIPAGLCVVGGAETAAKVGELSGKSSVAGEPMVSFRRCSREEGHVKTRFQYIGTATCASAALLEGGPYMCGWACIGLGDCMRACPFDAMYMENSMVEILPSRCVSCGQCVKACPRSIPQLIPRRARVMSGCATREKLKSVSEVCDVGCINCLKCLKSCPADAIAYEKRRIEIDHAACMAFGSSCGEACVNACSRGILRRRGNVPPQAERPVVDQSEPDSAAERMETAADGAPMVPPTSLPMAPAAPSQDGPGDALPGVATQMRADARRTHSVPEETAEEIK